MKITIHRGINQIGGCITEIATSKTRILIDLGQNLPDGEGNVKDDLANLESIANITTGVDAIFYTHYHGDHYGLFDYVPSSIPQYIGHIAKEVLKIKHQRLGFIKGREEQSAKELGAIDRMIPYASAAKVNIGDIRIIPYFVSHSACNAFMFVIEAEGKRILNTGDFRGHGYLSKGLLPTIKKYILSQGKIDFLITEGTMLSRMDEKVRSENELKIEIKKVIKQYKNVFVLCSSTDMERLATFHAAFKELGRNPFVCDDFQKDILNIFTNSAGKKQPLFNFGEPYAFNVKNTKLIKWMHDKGFCMLVRATEKFINYLALLEPNLNQDETVLIYSMWNGYVDPIGKHANKRYLNFIGSFTNIKKIHTSGHASADFLADVCDLVDPTIGIIPIHSEKSDEFGKLPIKDELKSKIIIKSEIIGDVMVNVGR